MTKPFVFKASWHPNQWQAVCDACGFDPIATGNSQASVYMDARGHANTHRHEKSLTTQEHT